MNDNFINIAIVIAVMVVVFALLKFFNLKARIIRELRKSPSKPINTVKDREFARVHGLVEAAEELLQAPLSKRPCVFYHITVEERADKSWRTIINDVKFQPFYLNSNGEKALILAKGKQSLMFYLKVDHKRKSDWTKKATAELEAYLKSHNKKSKSWLFNANKTLRYHEAVLTPGEMIVVKGTAEWIRLEEPIEGYNYSRLLKLTGSENKKMLLSDLPEALKTLPKFK